MPRLTPTQAIHLNHLLISHSITIRTIHKLTGLSYNHTESVLRKSSAASPQTITLLTETIERAAQEAQEAKDQIARNWAVKDQNRMLIIPLYTVADIIRILDQHVRTKEKFDSAVQCRVKRRGWTMKWTLTTPIGRKHEMEELYRYGGI